MFGESGLSFSKPSAKEPMESCEQLWQYLEICENPSFSTRIHDPQRLIAPVWTFCETTHLVKKREALVMSYTSVWSMYTILGILKPKAKPGNLDTEPILSPILLSSAKSKSFSKFPNSSLSLFRFWAPKLIHQVDRRGIVVALGFSRSISVVKRVGRENQHLEDRKSEDGEKQNKRRTKQFYDFQRK